MHAARYPKVLVSASFALILLGLLLVSLVASTVVRAQSNTVKGKPNVVTDTVTLESIGRLFFTDSMALRTGSFLFEISGLPTPPDNSHYELWLHSSQTPTLRLGALTFVAGQGAVQGKIGRNPLATYEQALISLEADEDEKISGPIILTATLPASFGTILTHLLVETASPLAETGVISGLMTGAHIQTQLAVKHTGFLREQLSQANLTEARRHTEHIINILDGKDGALYSDLDRNGQIQNPGDDVGIRSYLDEARTRALELLALTEAAAEFGEQAENVKPIMAALESGQAIIPISFDKAPKIFASDTVTEANVHARDLTIIIDDLAQQVSTAYTHTLQMATYTFYAPATPLKLPPSSTRPATPRTATATPQPTARLLQTGSVSATVTAIPTLAVDAMHDLHSVPVQRRLEISVTVDEGWRNPIDGSLYIYMPGGEFIIGATADTAASPREEPQHTVQVDEFWLQQSETTNQQYAYCVTAGVCTPPANERWNDPVYSDHPVTHITWQQANAYAAWVGGRLPTEAEWEAACRGSDAYTFPWGDESPSDLRSNYNNNVGDTTPVGSYPAGASPAGWVDLSGNVWEWVSSLETNYPYTATDGREDADDPGKRVVRGGSFYYTQYQIRCAARTGFAPDTASQPIGFRVAITAPITRWQHSLDEATYLYIPGGEFAMGSTDANAVSPREKPQHTVAVGDFWLQETETTNGQYARCVAASSCTPPANDRWDDPAYVDHPVINIDWQQANTYAAWVGGRLPTEAEWENACRGSDERTYPWGDEPPSDALSNYNNNTGDTVPVGSYRAGASSAGVLDLSGNVWEWVSSLEANYPYAAIDGREDAAAAGKRIVRGGSFYYTQYQIRCTARTGFAPNTNSQPIGLRVALDSPQ